LKVDK
jgi:hypothetical protein